MGANAVVTDEECNTGIACDGLAVSECANPVTNPVTDPVTDPVTESPITKTNRPVSEVTLNPTANSGVTDNPEIITASGNKLKAFGIIIALLAMLV